MPISTVQIIQAICPGLFTSPDRDLFIQIAMEDVNSGFFGSSYNKAVALKAAHVFVLSSRSLGESGTVTSKSEGSLSISYQNAKMASGNDDLDQTNYGKQLLNLIKQNGVAASVIGRPELVTNPDMSAEQIAQNAIDER